MTPAAPSRAADGTSWSCSRVPRRCRNLGRCSSTTPGASIARSRQAGAATALYMVWPSQARRGDFPDVSRSYTAAARAVGGLLLPAGDAWREAWQLDSRLALYGPDGFHASPLGSELAAITIFQAVTGQPPAILPFENLTPAQAAALRQAASATALAEALPDGPGPSARICAEAAPSFGPSTAHG